MRASYLFASALLLTLAACGPSEPTAPASPPAASTPAATPVATGPTPEEIQAAMAALPAPYSAADYEAGRRVFAQCRSCHTIEAGGPNRVGPNLHGLFTRDIGGVEGFNYSDPVKNADFHWDPEHLEHWLENPQTFLPGNRMAFAGVHDETQRHNLIAYLLVETAR